MHTHLHPEETGIDERLNGLLQLWAILPSGGLRHGRAAVRGGHRGCDRPGQQSGRQRCDHHPPEDRVPAFRRGTVTAHRPDGFGVLLTVPVAR
ncbi:hypothetical protein OUY22_26740, partial [Nonomuraea sp. MCN248]